MNKNGLVLSVILTIILLLSCTPRYARGKWNELPPLSESRSFLKASTIGDKIYVMGGTDLEVVARPVVDVFDIPSGIWVDTFSLPEESRAGHAQVVLDGEVWLLGGLGIPFVNDSVISYDPTEKSWKERPSMPYRLEFTTAEVVDRRIIVLGGRTPFPSEVTSYTLVFDPNTGEWTEKASMPRPRHKHETAVYDGKIYVFGGQNMKGGDIDMDVITYDPATDLWKTVAELPYPVRLHEALNFQNRIFLIGGQSLDSTENYSFVSILNPESAEWKEGPEMVNQRINFGCAVSGNDIYVFAGNIEKDAKFSTNLCEVYSF